MSNKINKIYDNDYSLSQYYSKDWTCNIGDENVPMTLVLEVVNMYDATGEDEYKDYPVVFTIGMINKNIHESITCDVDSENGEIRNLDDVIGYYGMNCYLDDTLYSIDEMNDNHKESLTIVEACLSAHLCRFSNQQKEHIKFKNEDVAKKYAEKLINNYGHDLMDNIGDTLSEPINLMYDTAWTQTDKFHKGK